MTDSKKITLSISLKPIQVDMIVDTDKSVVDELVEKYRLTPNEEWGGGIGLHRYFEEMWTGLKDGYAYFISSPADITHENQGWITFCNDCLRCAVLYSVMTGDDLEFVDVAQKREWLDRFLAKLNKAAESQLLQVSI